MERDGRRAPRRVRLVKRLRPAVLGLAVALGLFAAPAAHATVPACVPGSDTDKKVCTYRIPITVGGYQVQQDVLPGIPNPGIDGRVTRMEVDMVDADGTPVPIQRLMLHHIVFLKAFHEDPTCPGGYAGFDSRPLFTGIAAQRFYAAGEERDKMVMPDGYGYPVAHNDYWAMTYMVMNHKPTTDTAYIQYKVTVSDSPNMTSITPYWLDVRNCKADPIYNVPGTGKPGSTQDETSDFVMPESGRIVAGLGHVHGGARKLSITEPNCKNRVLAQSTPTWGLKSNPFYHVQPILHEPGPINMSAFGTPQGIPVKAGDTLRLNSLYENSRPHVRVMGIFIVYVAHDDLAQSCGAMPKDIYNTATGQPGRYKPVPFRIPLTGIDPKTGKAIRIQKPPGKTVRLKNDADIDIKNYAFSKPNVVVKAGTRLNWDFEDTDIHNVTLADGPVAIGSLNLNVNPDGSARTFSMAMKRPGTYKLFCALHPTLMQEVVTVEK